MRFPVSCYRRMPCRVCFSMNAQLPSGLDGGISTDSSGRLIQGAHVVGELSLAAAPLGASERLGWGISKAIFVLGFFRLAILTIGFGEGVVRGRIFGGVSNNLLQSCHALSEVSCPGH